MGYRYHHCCFSVAQNCGSVRSDGFRYTEWYPWNKTALSGAWASVPLATELYDYRDADLSNFDSLDLINVVNNTDVKDVINTLRAALWQQFKPSWAL